MTGRLISSTRCSSAAIAIRLSNIFAASRGLGTSAIRMYAEAPLENTNVGVPKTPCSETACVWSIGKVVTKTIEIEARILSHLLDRLDLVDADAPFMPRTQQGRVKTIESILTPCRLGGHKREPPAHPLACGGVPGSPALVLGVHLRQREIAPPNIYGSLCGHAREQQ